MGERLFNTLLGLSFCSLAVLGFFSAREEGITLVRAVIALLNVLVGILFIIRKPVIRFGSMYLAIVYFPSFVFNAFVFHLSGKLILWPLESHIFFLSGAAVTALSFLYLGRSFGVLPAIRGVVTKGPYKIIRHPAYFGEFLMALGCVLSSDTFWAPICLLGLLLSQMARIAAEESVFTNSSGYQLYKKETTWRLFPLLW